MQKVVFLFPFFFDYGIITLSVDARHCALVYILWQFKFGLGGTT